MIIIYLLQAKQKQRHSGIFNTGNIIKNLNYICIVIATFFYNWIVIEFSQNFPYIKHLAIPFGGAKIPPKSFLKFQNAQKAVEISREYL